MRHVRVLYSISQHGTFSAAAESLGIVPSALSEVVRQIEAQIGAPLFDRSTRPPSMTPLARDFLRDTEPLLLGMDRAISRLRQGAGLEMGSLAIGASPSAISELIAPVLGRFLDDHRGIDCVLHDDIAEELALMVSDGRLDLAIAGRAQHSSDLCQTEVMHDLVGLACHADHPLAAQDALYLADIPTEQLIGLDKNTGTYQLLMQSGLLPEDFHRPRLCAHSTISQLCMIRAKMGVALMPQNAVLLFRDPEMTFRQIKDLPLQRTLYLLLPARRAQSHVAQSFVARLERDMLGLRCAGD